MHSERTRKVGNVKDIFQEGNKLKQKIFALAMASAMIVSLFAGCGGSSGQNAPTASGEAPAVSSGTQYDKVTLKLSCNGTDIANDTRMAKLFAEKVKEKSGGAVTVNVFPNDQLASGNMSKGLELLCDGTVDLDIHSTSIIANLDNRMMVSTLPWLFKDYQSAEDAFFGKGGEFLNTVLSEKGLTYLGAVHNGFKAMTCGKHAIKSPEDLKGLKIRIPGGDFFSAFYTAFGASPQAMSWGEVFTALQQGTIDGHDNSLSTINSANVQEVQKYITISNHTYEAFTFTANTAKFEKLSAETQALIRQCVEEACKEMNQQIVADEAGLKDKFINENGCEIYELTEDDVAKFKAVVQPLIDQYKEVYGADACTAFGVQ